MSKKLRILCICLTVFIFLTAPFCFRTTWAFGITMYQKHLSPYKGYHCAYACVHKDLSCSAYGKQAIQRNGVIKGLRLLNKRFGECAMSAKISRGIIRGQITNTNQPVENTDCCAPAEPVPPPPPSTEKQCFGCKHCFCCDNNNKEYSKTEDWVNEYCCGIGKTYDDCCSCGNGSYDPNSPVQRWNDKFWDHVIPNH